MNHLSSGVVIVIATFVMLLTGCAKSVNQVQPNTDVSENSFGLGPKDINGRAIHPAFKGIELYSWQNESRQWCFSLLLGTNRNKSYSEVIAPELTIAGVTELKTRLGSLAKGESVLWLAGISDQPSNAIPELKLPPDDIIEQVVAYGKKQDINVHITKRGAQ